MDKKWYNYFVSVDEGKDDKPAAIEEEPLYPAPPDDEKAAARKNEPPKPNAAAGSAQSRSAAQTIADIAATVAQPKATPTASAASFDDIYHAAEISRPPHGYTILKVADMLQSEHIRSLAPSVKRSSILVALEAASVKVEEIIQDAIRRDRALDTYERVQQKALDEMETSVSRENQQIQAEIDKLVADHQARIQENNKRVAREKDKMTGWRVKKHQEEARISEAVSYFASPNPITTGSDASQAPALKPKGQAGS